MKKRVTGLGGIFFKANDPKKLSSWYQQHLGIEGVFKWKNEEHQEGQPLAQTVWSPFKESTEYFAPSEKQFMLNYRVEDLDDLLKTLKDEGITQLGEVQSYPYGKFAWIMDPEGNKVELWQPIEA